MRHQWLKYRFVCWFVMLWMSHAPLPLLHSHELLEPWERAEHLRASHSSDGHSADDHWHWHLAFFGITPPHDDSHRRGEHLPDSPEGDSPAAPEEDVEARQAGSKLLRELQFASTCALHVFTAPWECFQADALHFHDPVGRLSRQALRQLLCVMLL